MDVSMVVMVFVSNDVKMIALNDLMSITVRSPVLSSR